MKVTFPGSQPGSRRFLLLTVLVIIIIPLEMVKADHTTMCINFPHIRYRDKSLTSLGLEKFPQNPEFWNLFQENYIAGSVDVGDVVNKHRSALPAESYHPRGHMRIYHIKDQSTQRFYTGLYRVEFYLEVKPEKPDLHESLKALIIYIDDDFNRRQTIGEFIYSFPTDTNQCPPNDASKYMIISCGGASRAEPLVSNVILYVRNKSDDDTLKWPAASNEIVPNLKGRHTLNFYVRIPTQDCNQHWSYVLKAKMVLDRAVFGKHYVGDGGETAKKDEQFFFRVSSTYMNINAYFGDVPGASDALPSRSHSKNLDCSTKFSNYKPDLPWFAKGDSGQPGDRSYSESEGGGPYISAYTHACQAYYFRGRCFHNMVTLVGAKGKATKQLHNQNVAHENQIPMCEREILVPTVPDENTVNRNYYYGKPKKYNKVETEFLNTLDYLKKFATSCNTTYNGDPNCNISKVVIDVKRRALIELRGRSIHLQRRRLRLLDFDEYHHAYYRCKIEGTNRTRYSGNNCTLAVDKVGGVGFDTMGFPRLLWGLRKGHALVMAIAFLFVLPVNLFVTRYFKESFMSKRILYARIWYQVHLHGTFFLAVLLIAGLGIVYIAEFYLGSSLTEASIAHRVLGWLTFVLFLVLLIFGGFRGFEDPLRKITIWLHWALGLLFYLMMFIEMLTGVLIPGNGVASHDTSICEYDKNTDGCAEQKPAYTSGAFVHVCAWIIIEIIMHIIMMFFILISDKQMAIVKRRIFFPVLIPVVKEHSKVNAFGHSIRVVLLCVYTFLALSSTAMYIVGYIIYTPYTMKGLGPMEATHFINNSELVMAEILGDY